MPEEEQSPGCGRPGWSHGRTRLPAVQKIRANGHRIEMLRKMLRVSFFLVSPGNRNQSEKKRNVFVFC